jgi:hypothetical protein
LGTITNRDHPIEIGFLKSPDSDDRAQISGMSDKLLKGVEAQNRRISLSEGLTTTSRNSFEINQIPSSHMLDASESSEVESYGTRKVSATSTMSTHPDEMRDYEFDLGLETRSSSENQDWYLRRKSSFDESSSSANFKAMRCSNMGGVPEWVNSKESLAQVRHIGLRAVVPCPREEPDKRTSDRAELSG